MRPFTTLRVNVARLAAEGLAVEAIAEACAVSPAKAFEALKASAYRAFDAALADGSLVRPDRCSDCGTGGRIHGHHPDYFRPLDVEWLCPRCHKSRHRGPRRKWAAASPRTVVAPRPAPPPEGYSRPEEVAARLGVPVPTVRLWARTTDIPCVWLSRCSPRFRMSEVDAWASRRVSA